MELLDAGALVPGRLADRELSSMLMPDHAGGHDFGRGEDHAADGTFGAEHPPLPAPRIDALQSRPPGDSARAVEVPVRQSVAGRDHTGAIAQQRPHRFDRLRDLMRLERDDDVVLRAQCLRIVGAARMDDVLVPIDAQAQPIIAYRHEMLAAGDDAHFEIGYARQLGSDEASDRACAKHANLQRTSLPIRRCSPELPTVCSWYTTHQSSNKAAVAALSS